MKSSPRQPVKQLVLLTIIHVAVALSTIDAIAESPASGIKARTPWTTSRLKGSPEPPLPFTTQRAFPQLKFNRCLDMVAAPNGNRLFVLEQSGKIFSFPVSEDVSSADLALDVAKACDGVRNTYALVFHPDFKQHPYCYVCCIKAPNLEDGSQIIRFKVNNTDPPTLDGDSQQTILTWPSGGHNGCCLKFGPDGYLYISTGDGVGPNPPDTKQAGQDVTNLLSCILRVDVDHVDGSQNYRIPADNPFVDLANARGEIWAYGFRNPWRMSFDAKTGDLWVGDVGWELWELLDRVQPGGNYGWSVMEGRQPTNTEFPRGPTPILPPTIDHPHSESSSITDGLTYYGKRLKDLHGHHVYGDYDTGKLWAFRWDSGKVVDHREIADTTHRIVGFGEDNAGELYLLDHVAGTLHHLVPNASEDSSIDFPRKLSDTGLFDSAADHTTAPGVVPYSIAAELWSDHAIAQRFVAIPGDGVINASSDKWSYPKNSVLVKTLSLDMEQGKAATRRRMETQILHFDGENWQPYTYRWNDSQTDAELLDAAGAEQTFDVVDKSAPGGVRRQTWRFAGRGECQRCHNKWSGPPLGFNLPQLNMLHTYPAGEAPQLETLAHIQLLNKLAAPKDRAKLADPFDASAAVDDRARAYLHANCAHCHRLHAGGAVTAKMHFDVPLDKTNMVGVRPSQGTFGIHAAQVIAPGEPYRSVLLYRMSKLGGGRMPHIGSSELDVRGVQLIHRWLEQLPADLVKEGTEASIGRDTAAKRRREDMQRLGRLKAADQASQTEIIQQLVGSTSGALILLHAVENESLPDDAVTAVIDVASEHEDVRVRDLFERFLPPERRVKRLGSIVNPNQVLSLPGDVRRGEQIYFGSGAACANCHRIGKRGKEVGPNLDDVGKRLNPEQLLESILQPSKRIEPKYVTYLIETDEGQAITGLLLKKTATEVVLKDARNQILTLPTAEIERMAPQALSLMPELQLQNMTAQQAADLIAYLHSLK